MRPRVRTRPNPAPGRGKYERGKSPSERREEQRERLLSAAAEVFKSAGYARASVEAIVSRVGMSRRTFYEHFDDLEDVLLELHDHGGRALLRDVRAAIAAAPDAVAKLHAAIRVFLETVVERGAVARVVFREIRAAGPRHERRHQAVLEAFAELLAEGVAEAHRQGAVSRAPDELTCYAIIAAMEAVAMRYVNRGEEARALEAEPALVELIHRAFR